MCEGTITGTPAVQPLPLAQETLRHAFEVCVRKTRRNIADLADAPKTWAWAEDGRYETFTEGFFDIGNWTSSFFTGMALLAWRQTKDEYFLNHTLRLAPLYREKATERFLDMHHDAGFLYTLYSVALHKLTGDPAHREVGLAAAEALYQRFNQTGNFIRAWGRLDTAEQDNLAIIDCMMNLPLFYWAARESGRSKYYDAAVRQADTTLKCFIRPDGSVYHAFRFDLQTGRPVGGDNYCGHSVDSFWARGVTWAIYGFALSHRHTGDPKYLEAALRLARKFIAQLDAEVVPVWDFRLPAGAERVRDASAAAVAVCGFQELRIQGAADAAIQQALHALLNRICGPDYLNADERCRGVLRSAYGNRVAYSSWGDYFLMEALSRALFQFEGWW
ncbi:MAG TPA: glycoside hydrolase family 88 protein [Verrucomicrobiae bacterium]|nr:glycoside hydrolase family 88 protein [Verrucomicrobiae bacterium]